MEIEIVASLTFSALLWLLTICSNIRKPTQNLVSKIIQTMIELSCMKITRWQNILTPEVQRKESNKAKNSSNKIYVVSSKDSLHFK